MSRPCSTPADSCARSGKILATPIHSVCVHGDGPRRASRPPLAEEVPARAIFPDSTSGPVCVNCALRRLASARGAIIARAQIVAKQPRRSARWLPLSPPRGTLRQGQERCASSRRAAPTRKLVGPMDRDANAHSRGAERNPPAGAGPDLRATIDGVQSLRLSARRGGGHGARPAMAADGRRQRAGLRRLPFDEFRRLRHARRQYSFRHQRFRRNAARRRFHRRPEAARRQHRGRRRRSGAGGGKAPRAGGRRRARLSQAHRHPFLSDAARNLAQPDRPRKRDAEIPQRRPAPQDRRR